MAGKPPYFPFYPNDFAADGKVEAMTTEEVGAYILLLCKAWMEEPPGSLPADDKVLARWARMDLNRWLAVKSAVLYPFTASTSGRYVQKRMTQEYERFRKVSRSRTNAARCRWDRSEPDTPQNDANAMQMHSKCNAKGMHVSESLSERGEGGGAGGRGNSTGTDPPIDQAFDLTAEGLAQAWQFYRRGSISPKGETLPELTEQFAEMLKLKVDGQTLLDAITEGSGPRDRAEYFWQFKERSLPRKGKTRPRSEDPPMPTTEELRKRLPTVCASPEEVSAVLKESGKKL